MAKARDNVIVLSRCHLSLPSRCVEIMAWIELGINEDGNSEINISWEDITG